MHKHDGAVLEVKEFVSLTWGTILPPENIGILSRIFLDLTNKSLFFEENIGIGNIEMQKW